jgi:hypothetical protein
MARRLPEVQVVRTHCRAAPGGTVSPPSPTLRFAYEWEPGDGVRSPELAATWCRLEIWVGNDCVSRVEDIGSGSTRRSLYGSLYPLAEWLAYNWWLIHAHTRPTALPSHRWSFSQLRHANRREYAWLRHHNMRAAGDGLRLSGSSWNFDGDPE